MAKLTAKQRLVLQTLADFGHANAGMIAASYGKHASWAHDPLRVLFFRGLMTTTGAGPRGSTMCAVTPAGRLALSQEKNDD